MQLLCNDSEQFRLLTYNYITQIYILLPKMYSSWIYLIITCILVVHSKMLQWCVAQGSTILNSVECHIVTHYYCSI